MKSRFVKALALVMTLCMLTVCLTGCETLHYREAVQRYNARQYEKAAELFSQLGNYEDAPELLNDCHYWMAMELMEAENYEEALPRFMKLGKYEDSAQRVQECKYQMAIAAFEEENYTDAESLFHEVSDYRLAGEYLRQLRFQKFYAYLQASGSEGLSETVGDRTVTFAADPDVPNAVRIVSAWSKSMGYSFRDDLTLTVKRESTAADFTATSAFAMAFGDGQIGSEQTGSGTVELSGYTPGTALTLTVFQMTGTDNKGNATDSQDPAHSTMGDAMVAHMAAIWQALPPRLAAAGTDSIF